MDPVVLCEDGRGLMGNSAALRRARSFGCGLFRTGSGLLCRLGARGSLRKILRGALMWERRMEVRR